MTMQEILMLLVQFPIIGIFIWYSDKKDKQFMSFLDEQRKADRDVMKSLLDELKALREDHDAHDQRMSQAVSTMEERTRRARAR